MKRLIFALTSCVLLVTSCNTKVDYSGNEYVGFGSTYLAVGGTSTNYAGLAYYFEPDGTGAWRGYIYENGSEETEMHGFTYRISGGVNVSVYVTDTKEKFSGYFTTTSNGQAFVTDGYYFYRYN